MLIRKISIFVNFLTNDTYKITVETQKDLTDIKIKYFEPNCTSWVQPVDQGIILCF